MDARVFVGLVLSRSQSLSIPALSKSFWVIFFTFKNIYEEEKMLINAELFNWSVQRGPCSFSWQQDLDETWRFEKEQWYFATSLWTPRLLPASLSTGRSHLMALFNRSPGVRIKEPVWDSRVRCCPEAGRTERQKQGCHFPARVKWVNVVSKEKCVEMRNDVVD